MLGLPRKYRAIGDIAAILSQYRAIWGHEGIVKFPVSTLVGVFVGPRGAFTQKSSTFVDIFVYTPVCIFQNKPYVRNFSTRNSGARNDCANLMGAWHFWVLSAGKPPRP